MSQPTRREQQAEQRRGQLIDIAMTLFAERGFERTTIKDLAAAAGVAQGLVYHYFASKDELLLAVIDRHNPLPQIAGLLDGVADQPAATLLPLLLHGFHAIMAEKRPLLQIGLRQMLVDERIRDRIQGLQRRGMMLLARYLAARVAAGELRPHNTEVTAQALLGGAAMLLLTDTAPEPFIAEFVANLLRGVAA